MEHEIRIQTAELADAEAILALQKQAYLSEARIYNDYQIPPLLQTLDQLREQFQDHTILKAVENHQLVGSVRSYAQNGTYHIGRLIVDPNKQRRGIGSLLMREIERRAETPQSFSLFTGPRSEGNLRLYRRLGYREVADSPAEDGMLYLAKTPG